MEDVMNNKRTAIIPLEEYDNFKHYITELNNLKEAINTSHKVFRVKEIRGFDYNNQWELLPTFGVYELLCKDEELEKLANINSEMSTALKSSQKKESELNKKIDGLNEDIRAKERNQLSLAKTISEKKSVKLNWFGRFLGKLITK